MPTRLYIDNITKSYCEIERPKMIVKDEIMVA